MDCVLFRNEKDQTGSLSLIGKVRAFDCGDLPQRSVSSGCAAARCGAGVAARFPAGKSGQYFAGLYGFAGRTNDLHAFVAGPEQHFKFIFTFLALEFIDRHKSYLPS
jgi:hypothetical protein